MFWGIVVLTFGLCLVYNVFRSKSSGLRFKIMIHIVKTKEKIDIIVVFEQDKARPYSFKWGGKKYVVEKINLVYAKNTGTGKFLYYSVTAEGNYFKLIFDTNEMMWWVEEVYSE